MEKWSETPQTLKEERLNHLNSRWGQLYTLEKEWGEKAIRYLMLTNSGGAIATLSFIGSSGGFYSNYTKYALFLFILGVFLVGIATAYNPHRMTHLFDSYREDANKYFSDEIEWKQLCDNDESRVKEGIWNYLFAYGSFGCFIIGSILGAIALFS